ncbi:MAG: hypothetical protein QM765_34130 [Myxococcales bacterium]
MSPWSRAQLQSLAVVTVGLALSCAKLERDEVFNGERVDVSEQRGLVPGHLHLFELVQWGSPRGGIVASKRARRDALRLTVAQRRVELLEAKTERGVMEVREQKVIRVKYTAENWERKKATAKRPPDGKIEPSTTMAPQQPGRPAHEVPAVIVEEYQEQMPKEVVRTPEEARAYWAPQLEEARKALENEQALAKARAEKEVAGGAEQSPPVERTRVSFAVLPLSMRQVMFEPPRHPRGYAVDQTGPRRRSAYALSSTGSVSPEPQAFVDRAALEKGVELTERITVTGVDSDQETTYDPKDGKLVLKLVGRCPVRVFHVRQELIDNGAGVIAVPRSAGFAEWYEIALPRCADAPRLQTRVTDLVAGAAAKEEPALDGELLRLDSDLRHLDVQTSRIKDMKAR